MFSASRAGYFESPRSARYLMSAVSLTGRYATLYASNHVSVALLFLVYAHYQEHIGFRLPALALGSRLCRRRTGTHCRSQYRCHQSSSLRRPSNWCRPKMGEREHEPRYTSLNDIMIVNDLPPLGDSLSCCSYVLRPMTTRLVGGPGKFSIYRLTIKQVLTRIVG